MKAEASPERGSAVGSSNVPPATQQIRGCETKCDATVDEVEVTAE